MRVHLIKRQVIEDYVVANTTARKSFENWLSVIKVADWDKPDDIFQTFSSADLLGSGSNRVVFNISGNNYRLICSYHFGYNKIHLFICWLGTHAEYDELCRKREQYRVKDY